MSARQLPVPEAEREAVASFVSHELGHLACDGDDGFMSVIRGGQAAADAALASFDVTGYASRRNEVWPPERRGASRLSPYIRHGLLPLRRVWDHVGDGPQRDVRKFRDELAWQEFARHWYATVGTGTRRGIRRELSISQPTTADGSAWDRSMRCVAESLDELEGDGWLVNQARMWLASHWAVRKSGRWQDGEDEFFRHLLDGSRAANRLGWQWTTGAGSSKPYGFSRWQVNKRSPGMCAGCEHNQDCPIEEWPADPDYIKTAAADAAVQGLFGPTEIEMHSRVEAVWLTAESLGDDDPALSMNPDVPVVFVFDEPLLARLRLAKKRLAFLTETLAELAQERPLELWLGRPGDVLAGRNVAVTHAPVPGFRSRAAAVSPVEVHPWLWLYEPVDGTSVSSFSAWRKKAGKVGVR